MSFSSAPGARAEAMLGDVEGLTEFLGSSGLAENMHVPDVSGRQRMLSQRMAKLCFLLAVSPDADRPADLRALAARYQAAMAHLEGVPLSSAGSRTGLGPALGEGGARARAVASTNRLLDLSERLTDQYEQAMQVLIGDRLGRLGAPG